MSKSLDLFMSKKLTIDERLSLKKINRPNPLFYGVLKLVARFVLGPGYGVKVKWKTNFSKVKGPYILISNHASRADYLFNSAFLKRRVNHVLGYNEFFRSHLSSTVQGVSCIPKKNFQFEPSQMKKIKNIIDKGGIISIYPEGMSSINGANQPVAFGTGSFLKTMGVPVYYSVIKGGYLSCPKYNLNDRHGVVESVLDIMFSKDDLENMTSQEIEDRVNKLLYHDDYEWNKKKKYHYKSDGKIAEGLETLLYYCPRCKKEHVMKTDGNRIYCTNCGNGATLDDTYEMHPFDGTCIIPETQTKWHRLQRELVKELVKNPNFEMKEKVKLGLLPDYELLKNQATSEIVGEGEVIINRNGLTYVGTRKDKNVTINVPLKDLPTYGMCTDVTRFYTFFDGVFHEFYPEHNVVAKWFLVTEELHRLMNGKWQDFKFDVSIMAND